MHNRTLPFLLLGAGALGLVPVPARAQLTYETFAYPGSNVTTVTGIRGNNMTGNYSITGTSGDTGGLLYRLPSLTPAPFPTAAAAPVNFPGATSATPYGPSFGTTDGILRVVGSYKTATSGASNLGYLYDAAAAPERRITTLVAPAGSSTTLNTIAHSTFGTQVVGNYDTRLATGNAFLYDIPTASFTTINRPGAVSTTAYGIYAGHIAGGSSDGPGLSLAYILNQDTGIYRSYSAPGVGQIVTHFEGITGGGRAGTFNLVADSADANGPHAWVVHVDATGAATWIELAVPSAAVTSANSIYGNTAIGVYVLNGVTSAFTVNIPGIYDPRTNNGSLTAAAAGSVAVAGNGDDVVNTGTINATGPRSVGIRNSRFGLVTNTGTIAASGPGSSAIEMGGLSGVLVNRGTISAQPGAFALSSGSDARGTWVFNAGVIDGAVALPSGPDGRFENSGWMGVSGPGPAVTHQVSGTFAQTASGTLTIRIAPGGVSDRLAVDGTARLSGTLALPSTTGAVQDYQLGSRYTVVSASGGISGAFGTVTLDPALTQYLTPVASYDATTASVSLNPTAKVFTGGGEQSGDMMTARIAALGAVSDAILGTACGGAPAQSLACRADTAADGAYNEAWVQGLGGVGGLSGGSLGGASNSYAGTLVGYGRGFGNVVLGAGAGYLGTNLAYGNGSSSSQSAGLGFIYGRYSEGPLELGAAVSFGGGGITARRVVDGTGLTAQGNAAGSFASVGLRAAYSVPLGPFAVQPRADLAFIHAGQGGYGETGAGALNLNYAPASVDTTYAKWMIRGMAQLKAGSWTISPYLEAGAMTTFSGLGRSVAVSAGPFGMTASGISPAPLAGVVGAGAEAALSVSVQAYLRYQGLYSANQSQSAFGAGVRYRF